MRKVATVVFVELIDRYQQPQHSSEIIKKTWSLRYSPRWFPSPLPCRFPADLQRPPQGPGKRRTGRKWRTSPGWQGVENGAGDGERKCGGGGILELAEANHVRAVKEMNRQMYKSKATLGRLQHRPKTQEANTGVGADGAGGGGRKCREDHTRELSRKQS